MGVVTWNLQRVPGNWATLVSLAKDNIGAMCLQETGNGFAAPDMGYAQRDLLNGARIFSKEILIGTADRGSNWLSVITPFGAFQATSIGVLGRTRPGHGLPVDVIPSQNVLRRPVIGVRLGTGVWVYSVHAPASGGSPSQMQYIQMMLAQIALNTLGEGWMCAGDFNASPAQVQAVIPQGSEILSCHQVTQASGGELDFLVQWPASLSHSSASQLSNSDHRAVSFY